MGRKKTREPTVDPELEDFAARLTMAFAIRGRERGLERGPLAATIDVDPGQVTRYLSGETGPSTSVLMRLALGLAVRADWLLFGDEPSGLGKIDVERYELERAKLEQEAELKRLQADAGRAEEQIHEPSKGESDGQVPKQKKLRAQRDKTR